MYENVTGSSPKGSEKGAMVKGEVFTPKNTKSP